MKKIGILTSGGDAPGMNAAVRAAVRCGIEKGMQVYGIYRGYEGLIDGEIREMDLRSVGDILHRGGTVLKTARSKRFMTEKGIDRAMMVLDTFGIEDLICIGGDGTLHGALELSKRGVRIMGLPGTIDNDLGYTDYTIGFDTAVMTVLDAISKIRDTSTAHERVCVVEVMGRHCGDIALYAGLTGGAEAVVLPEVKPDVKEICRHLITSANSGKMQSIIVIAEGAEISSDELVRTINKLTGRDVKRVVLSYLQRGGSPTMSDRMLASLCAAKAINLIEEESESKAIGILDGKIIAFDLAEALEQKREFKTSIYNLIGVLGK